MTFSTQYWMLRDESEGFDILLVIVQLALNINFILNLNFEIEHNYFQIRTNKELNPYNKVTVYVSVWILLTTELIWFYFI